MFTNANTNKRYSQNYQYFKNKCLPFGKRYHVYFVYRPVLTDKSWVDIVVKKLTLHGYICGCSEKGQIPGEFLHRNIIKNIKSSMKIVVVLSESFLQCRVCDFEFSVALSFCIKTNQQHTLIPVILDKCEIPESLISIICLDVSDGIEKWWPVFFNAIENDLFRDQMQISKNEIEKDELLKCHDKLLSAFESASIESQRKFLDASRASGLTYFVSQMGTQNMFDCARESCGVKTTETSIVINWTVFHEYLMFNNQIVKRLAHYIDYTGKRYSKLSFIFKNKTKSKDMAWKSGFQSFAELVLQRDHDKVQSIRPLQDFNGHNDGFLPEVAQLTEVLLQVFPPCKELTYYEKYETYDKRLISFQNCLAKSRINIEKLAEAGFFFSGYTDLAATFCCGMRLFGWKKDDEPWINHAYYRPHCTYVQRHKGEKFIQNARLEKDEKLKTPQECEEYRTFESRLQSFIGFNRDYVDPYDLADAGFYYCVVWKQNDNVTCFSCGLRLYDWQSRGHPWVEHAKWSPNCNHVIKEKGTQFVNMINSKYNKDKNNIMYELHFTFGEAMRVDKMLEISEQNNAGNNDLLTYLNEIHRDQHSLNDYDNQIYCRETEIYPKIQNSLYHTKSMHCKKLLIIGQPCNWFYQIVFMSICIGVVSVVIYLFR